MRDNLRDQQGLSLVELMIAIVISVVLSLAVIEIYLAQTHFYKTSNSQTLIQSGTNAIANLVTPVIRSAGFVGCGNISTTISNLNPGGPIPLGAINTTASMIQGYSGGTSSITLTTNAANSSSASNWSPSLDSTLVGAVEPNNDVIVVLGASIGSNPLGLTTTGSGTNAFSIQSAANVSPGQYGAVSDCTKSIIFQITGVAGTTITHNSAGGVLANASSTFPISFQVGAQFIPIQQTAFFVGQGQGGQSALMRATLVGGTWSIQPIIPGVDLMKVQYGIGTSGVITQYVPASLVTNWAQVYSVRIGFLIEGQIGSTASNTTQYTVLDIPVTTPADNRIRHEFELTVNLRNALS